MLFVLIAENTKLYCTHKENLEALEAALEIITTTMANCEFYASIYSNSQESASLQSRFQSALPEFFATVLVFSVKAKGYFAPSSTSGISNLEPAILIHRLTFMILQRVSLARLTTRFDNALRISRMRRRR